MHLLNILTSLEFERMHMDEICPYWPQGMLIFSPLCQSDSPIIQTGVEGNQA